MARSLLTLLLLALALVARAAAPIPFTPEEARWIAAHPVVDYAFNPRAPPFSYEENGRHLGFSADIMAALSEHTGIRFRPMIRAPWPQVLDKARTGELLLVAQLAITPERARFLQFTEPVLDLPYGIFTGVKGPFIESLDDLRGKRIGVPRDFAIHEQLREHHPHLQLIPFESAVEGMTRLSIGEYDAVITNVGTATYVADVRGVQNLRLRSILPEHFEFAIGVNKAAPELFTIVNRALAAIPPDEMRAMKNRWLTVTGPGFTRAETIAIAGGVAAAIFMFAAVNIAFLYMRLRHRYAQLMEAEDKLQRLATVDDLTGLGNRRAYNKAIEAELKRADRMGLPLAFVELDIDYFKAVNDQHGHEAGDRALIEIGRLIRRLLRINDQAFRTGGEEFVVLLPATDRYEAEMVAERLRRSIEQLRGLARPLTASFGCAVLPAGVSSSSDHLFAVADAALYQAKADGRNRVRTTLIAASPAPDPAIA